MDYSSWHDSWPFGPIGVFGFVLALVLMNGIFSVLKTRAVQATMREAIKNGQDIDPGLLRSIEEEEDRNGGGSITAGLILMAVAVGLVFLGHQIEKVEQDEPVFEIMLGVAGIPFLIGVVLFISGLLKASMRKGQDKE